MGSTFLVIAGGFVSLGAAGAGAGGAGKGWSSCARATPAGASATTAATSNPERRPDTCDEPGLYQRVARRA